MYNFNSIKVQLEHIISQQKKPSQPFQFHKGTIRTNLSEGSKKEGGDISIP